MFNFKIRMTEINESMSAFSFPFLDIRPRLTSIPCLKRYRNYSSHVSKKNHILLSVINQASQPLIRGKSRYCLKRADSLLQTKYRSLFHDKYGIAIGFCSWINTVSPPKLYLFSIYSGEFFRNCVRPKPPYMTKLFSPRIWANHWNNF